MEAVLADTSGRALEDLQALVDKSLVRSTPARDRGRRLTLYESIRAFALAKLDEDPAAAERARARHRAWFVGLGARLVGELQRPDGLDAYRRLVDEIDNGFSVVEQALRPGAPAAQVEDGARAMVALHEALLTRGPLALADSNFRALRAAPVTLPPDLRALLCACHCYYLVLAGDRDGALATREEALDEARAANSLCVEAIVHWRVRSIMRFGHDAAELARAGLARAVELLDQGDCALSSAEAHEGLGLTLLYLNRLGEAESSFRAALASVRRGAAPLAAGMALNNYEMLRGRLGDWDEAEVLFEEALAAASAAGQLVLGAVVQSNLGECLMRRGDLERASAELGAALEAASRAGYQRGRMIATAHLAGIAHARGLLAEAQDLYQEALSFVGTSWADPVVEAVVRSLVGLCAVQRDADDREAPLAEAAWAVADLGDPFIEAMLELCQVMVALHRGQISGAAARDRMRAIAARVDTLAATTTPNRRHLPDFAAGLLAAALGAADPGDDRRDEPRPATTRIAADGRSFVTAGGEEISLGRRAGARRILALLAAARVERPGRPVSADEVYAAGWPGDAVGEPHRSNRIYVMMSKLRKAGLGELLIHDGDGYQLDPRLPVTLV